jgi:hypothetical protein
MNVEAQFDSTLLLEQKYELLHQSEYEAVKEFSDPYVQKMYQALLKRDDLTI